MRKERALNRNNSTLTHRITQRQLQQLAANTANLRAVSSSKSMEIHHHIEDAEPAGAQVKRGEAK